MSQGQPIRDASHLYEVERRVQHARVIMAWRDGKTNLSCSPRSPAPWYSAQWPTRAPSAACGCRVIRACSRMGKIMALALACTMAAAVLFQPVLMGRPRQIGRLVETPSQAAE